MSAFLLLIEEDVKPIILRQCKLAQCSSDGPVLTALGGEDRAKIALAHMCGFLKTADKTDFFFFFVANSKGIVWDVDAHYNRSRDAWNLDAVMVRNSTVMLDVHRVVSPVYR